MSSQSQHLRPPLAFRRQQQYQLHQKSSTSPSWREPIRQCPTFSSTRRSPLLEALKADTSIVLPATPARSPSMRIRQSQLPRTSAQIHNCANSLFNWGEQILASSNVFAFISPSPLLPLHSNRERGGMLAKVERTTEHATINMATNNSMGKWFSL